MDKINRIIGYKKKELYDSFIKNFIPDNIEIYCEPFGGGFNIHNYLQNKPKISIYNDINSYDFQINADVILHKDYKEIFKEYDSINTVWYLDPPYYKKEFIYDNCENYDDFFHEELKNEIDKLKGKVTLSYEDKTFIRNLYKKYNIHFYSGDKHVFNKEIIITKNI